MAFDMVAYANRLLAGPTREGNGPMRIPAHVRDQLKPQPPCCATCEYFDGDAFCTMPKENQRFTGSIRVPEDVVCASYEPREDER